jgi:hypothetical protein
MSAAPTFFVPPPGNGAPALTYAELAKFAQVAVPPDNQRVYSISYTHDGETWTSTVGQASRGIRRRTVGRGSTRREYEEHVSDPAIVLAIFPGNPFVIVTNHLPGMGVRSTWANPFYMGPNSISSTVLFSA